MYLSLATAKIFDTVLCAFCKKYIEKEQKKYGLILSVKLLLLYPEHYISDFKSTVYEGNEK